MTKRLYLENPYVDLFEADIVDVRDTEDGPALIFEKTHFYPESGGQPDDRGTIDGVPVKRVLETADETILHIVETLPKNRHVRCQIDTSRRHDHMQQHSGQHVLSAAFLKEIKAQTTSFHLGADTSTIDVDKRQLTWRDIETAEGNANEVVQRNVDIQTRFVSDHQAESLELRKSPPKTTLLRIVDINGIDQQACCGTHPQKTSEIGPIVVRNFSNLKNGTRIEFLCGNRVLMDYRLTVSRTQALTSILNSSEAELVNTAEKLQKANKTTGKELAKFQKRALIEKSESYMSEATQIGPYNVLTKNIESLKPSELRSLAQQLVHQPGRIVFLGSIADFRAHLIFACSNDIELNMANFLDSCVKTVDGKGGGNAQIAQGGGPNTDHIDEALNNAEKLLKL